MATDTYSVSYIRHDMRGAPVINGATPGSLIAVLDALLITGWGAAAPDSITVASGVAIAQFASAIAWEVGAVLQIDGATPAAIDGKGRVLASSGNTLTFSTTAPDGSYSGAGIKYAPAGWEKPFSATNKAVYRSADPLGNRHFLRVDDSGNRYARVRGYEAMSDLDTGTAPFPTTAQVAADGGYWWRSHVTSAKAAHYLLAADARLLLLAIASGQPLGATRTQADVRGFGEPLPLSPAGDAYSTLLSWRGDSAEGLDSGQLSGSVNNGAQGAGCTSARSWAGTGGAAPARIFALTGIEASRSGNCALLGAAPSGVDGQVKTSALAVRDVGVGSPPRAYVPGVFYIPQTGAADLLSTAFETLPGGGELIGRRVAVIHQSNSSANDNPTGAALIDLTGPWR